MYQFLEYWRRMIKALGFAIRGLWYVARTQRNFHIHLLVAAGVIGAGVLFGLSTVEWLVIVITIFLVLSAEAFNTAVEKLVDLVSPEYNKLAGLVKDIAAGAVLLMATMAVIVGIIIFLPRIVALF